MELVGKVIKNKFTGTVFMIDAYVNAKYHIAVADIFLDYEKLTQNYEIL